MLDDALRGQIQHPAQRIIVGKGRLVLRDLSELTVQALNDICRVYDPANLHGIFKEAVSVLCAKLGRKLGYSEHLTICSE